jgi:toxin FitB
MNLVDSCGWLEYFADGPLADYYARALEGPSGPIVPTLCIYEVFKKVSIERGEEMAMVVSARMQACDVAPLDPATALLAARLSVALKLPMADSVILATARERGAVLWTHDTHFREIPGVRFPVPS